MLLPPRLFSGTVISTVGRVIGTALSVLTIGVITRSLTANGGVGAYGQYATVFAFLAVIAVVADGGLYLVFTRASAVTEDREEEARLLARVLLLRLSILLGVLGSLAIVISLLRYPPLVRHGMLVGSLGIAAQLTTQLTLGVFQKRLRMIPPAAGEVAGRAVTFVLALLFATANKGVLAFVGAFVVGALVTLVWNIVAVRQLLSAPVASVRVQNAPLRDRNLSPVPKISSLIREAWPLGFLLIFWMIVFRADSVLLSYFQPPEHLGWYALPYKVLESLLFFPAMIGGLLLPRFSQFAARAEPEKFRNVMNDATDLFTLLVFPAVILLVLFAPTVIALLGGDAFAPSVPVLRILAVALGALFFGNLYGNSAVALGAQRPLLGAALLLAVANITVNLFVIPRFSFLGAAWTTLGTEILSAVAAGLIVVRRVGRLSGSPRRFHLLSAGGVFLLVTLVPLPLLFRALFGLLTYIGALFFLRVLTPAHLRALLRAQQVSHRAV